MKLKLKADPTFEGPVKIPVPGQKEHGQVAFTFKHRTKTEHKAFMDECRAEGSKTATGAGFVLAVATAWDMDEPFTAENIDTFLQNYHMAEAAIAIAYTNQLLTAASGN